MSDQPDTKKPTIKKPGFAIFLPLIITLGLFGLMAATMLGGHNPREVKSVLIGGKAPDLVGATLMPDQRPLDPEKPTVINFFASWCTPCRAEHENLVTLAATGDINLIGIAFQNKPAEALLFLDELGNPYHRVLKDPNASLAFGFGVAAVPETFIIDKGGVLRYRLQGPIVGDLLDKVILGEIAKWR